MIRLQCSWRLLNLVACVLLMAIASRVGSAQCTPVWLELAGLPGFDAIVNSLCVLNDGTGEKLYAGGGFSVAGGATASRIARFDGVKWSAMGDGFNAVSYTGVVHNGEVYAGGDFTLSGATSVKRVARWDGSAWKPVGAGFDDGTVYCLFEFNSELYASGAFTLSGGVPCVGVAKWTGTAWQQVGAGLNKVVYCLTSYQNQLYAGGTFSTSGGTAVSNVARFDGTNWQPVLGGTGGGDFFPGVYSMVEFNGSLHVAGGFTNVDGVLCYYAARWNGSAWTRMTLPAGGSTNGARSLAVYNNELYCGGTMAVPGGVYLAKWTGSAWTNVLGAGFNTPSSVTSLAVFQGSLYFAGGFQRVNGNAFNYIGRYDGSAFKQVGTGFDLWVNAMAEFNNQLIIGGRFITAGGFPAFHVVRYDGEQYLPMGNELLGDDTDIETNDFCVHNGELYAAGQWTVGGTTKRVAKWNGTAWVALPAQPIGSVNCIASFNGDLVIGGFGIASGSVNVLRYNGTSWVPMGAGLNNEVFDLYAFNGSLYAGGQFSASGATPMSFVARWDGTQWNPVGGSVTAPGTAERVWNFNTFNNQLVAGGSFTTLGGVVVNGVARLNGNVWASFGTGFINGGPVTTLSVLNGSLIAGGVTRPSGVTTTTWVSRWDGAAWLPIGQNFSGFRDPFSAASSVRCSVTFQNELFVGGDFFKAGGRASSFVAHWGSEPPCIQLQPIAQAACPGQTVVLSVSNTGVPPLTYQWRKNSAPISDGAQPSGAIVSGATTRTLTLTGVAASETGDYDVVITNSFGNATSNSATLPVRDCPYGTCVADYDASGGTPDSTDIEAYFSDWLLGSECADADCSGGTPDSTDIEIFFGVWLAGGC